MAINQTSEDHAILLSPAARGTHVYVIGQPGAGKSRALESWIMQDVAAGRGVGVIDPHGELFDHLVSRIARLAEEEPSIAHRVVIINPVDRVWTVGLNPLEPIPGIPTERLAGLLTDVVIKIWKVDATAAPRMIRLLTFTFLALAQLHLTLADLPWFLLEEEWRNEQLERITYPEVAQYFHSEFPTTGGGTHQWVTPVLNKIGALLFDPDLRLMFSIRSTVHFRQIIDGGLILLINLSKGQLGEGNSALLGAFIVAHLQQAALARDGRASKRPFFLYLDEFQNFTTDNIKDILSESRKYGLSLVLAHQYLDQLPPELLGAVLNTTGTLACFRVGYRDATLLAHELFPPRHVVATHWELNWAHLNNVPIPIPTQYSEPLGHEDLATLLTQLKPREFVARHRGPYPPRKQRTFDMPAPAMSDHLCRLREELLKVSGQRYGRLKYQVQAELNHDPPIIISQYPTFYEEVPPAALSAGS